MAKINRPFLWQLLTSIVLGIIFGFYKIGLDDHWWHLANGKIISETGKTPVTDIFSFTHYGKSVNNWERLWDYGTYSIWNSFGPEGLIILRIIIISLIFLTMYRCLNALQKEHYEKTYETFFIMTCLIFITALLIHPRLSDRPHLAGYLFMIISLMLSIKHRSATFSLTDFLFPGLILIWVPTHPSWPLGLLIYCALNADRLINIRKDRDLLKKDLFKTGIILLTTISLVFLIFKKELLDSFQHSNDLNNVDILTEWVSFQESFRLSAFNIYFLLLALIFVAVSVKSIRNNFFYSCLILAFLIQSFFHVRFIIEFSILSIPYIYNAVLNNIRFDKKYLKHLILFLFLFLSINSRQYWGYEAGFGISEKKNPVSAVEFMRKMNMRGNLYSPQLEAHNYVLFMMNPSVKVFIDGRIPLLYPVSFLEFFKSNSIQELENKGYRIDLILLTSGIYTEKNTEFISGSIDLKKFKLVHFTENDALFINSRYFNEICPECSPYEMINPWKMLDDEYIKTIQDNHDVISKELNYYNVNAPETQIKQEILKILEPRN